MNWRRLTPFRPKEDIPSWIGLSLTVLYLGLVLALGVVSFWFHESELAAARQADALRWVYWLGRDLAHCGSRADLEVTVRRIGREPGVIRCEVVDRQGLVVASSAPSRAGQRVPDEMSSALLAVADHEASTLSLPGAKGPTYAVRLPAETGGTIRWLVLETSPGKGYGSAAAWWGSVGYVVLAGLGALWALYRLVWRAFRPLASIQQRLLTCGQKVEEQIALLRVNDSLGQAAASWNRLVEFIAGIQEELRALQLRNGVDTTLDGYRSERLAAVLRQIPHGVIVVEGEEQKISFANRSAARMLGRGDEDLIGAPVSDVLPEAIRKTLLSGAARTGGRWIDQPIEAAGGATTVRFTAVPIEKDSPGSGRIVFLQDVSQLKEVERARDSFLYHVTHELRTPLTNIRAYAETLAGGVIDDPASLRECYNVISGETERLSRLVENILSVSQLEVGTARLNFGEVHVERLIRDVVQDMQATADEKGLDLRLRLPPKVPVIRGDKERLAAALANLVGNAIKYTPSGGTVEVSCTVEGDPDRDRSGALTVAVSDTGIGIDPQHHEKIFEKFYRVDDERVEAQPGTGLGLAIVKETIRLHGGSVRVDSTPGRGSTFTVTLPVGSP